MVWRWGVSGAPLTVEADSLLWTLNELLRDSAILIQPLCLPDAAVRHPPAAQGLVHHEMYGGLRLMAHRLSSCRMYLRSFEITVPLGQFAQAHLQTWKYTDRRVLSPHTERKGFKCLNNRDTGSEDHRRGPATV